MKSNKKLHQSAHSAFSTSSQSNQSNQQTADRSDQINQNQNQNPFFRNRGGFRDRDREKNGWRFSFQKKTQRSECICGNFHFYSDCYYINFINRSIGWNPDSETVKRVIEAMKNPEIKARVDHFMKKRQEMMEFNK